LLAAVGQFVVTILHRQNQHDHEQSG
jgi:hypothetical protein